MADKVAETLLDIEANFTQLESLYNSLSNNVTNRQQEISEDYDQWTSIYNTLLNYIKNIKNIYIQAIEQYKKHKEINETQTVKITTLQKEIDNLKAENIKPENTINPYQDLHTFLDKLEILNRNQQKEWNNSKENSQMVIENVLKMLQNPTKIPQVSQQLKEKDNKIKELLNRIEYIQKEQEVSQMPNSFESEKDKQIQTLRTQLQQQIDINNENKSEIERLNKTISNYESECKDCKDKNGLISKLENELFALNSKMKTENEVTQSAENNTNNIIEKLNEKLTEEKLKNINMTQKVKELNEENENLKEEINGLQNEMYKNNFSSKIINDSTNESKLKQKLEDILQILYFELTPNNQSLDSVESVKGALEKWKQTQMEKIKNRYENDTIKQLNNELKEKDKTMKLLEKTNKNLKKENKQLNRIITNLRKEINTLKNGNKFCVNINLLWVWLCWLAVWGSCIVVGLLVFVLMVYFGTWTF